MYTGQVCVVWIGNNINVTVIVGKLIAYLLIIFKYSVFIFLLFLEDVSPISPGILGFLTEVHIKEQSERKVSNPTIIKNDNNDQKWSFDIEKLKSLSTLFNKKIKCDDNFKKFSNLKQDLVYRVVPLRVLPNYNSLGNQRKLFNVFILKKNLPTEWIKGNSLTSIILCSITLLTDDIFYDKNLYIRIIAFEDLVENAGSISSNNLYVSDDICNYFQCGLGSRVLLKYIEQVPPVRKIDIYTKRNYVVNIEEHFKKFLADNSDDVLVLNSDVVFDIGNNIMCSVKLSPVESKFVVVDDDLVRNCQYSVCYENITAEPKITEIQTNGIQFLENIANYSIIIKEILHNFNPEADIFENILLIGKYALQYFKIVSLKI